MGKKKQLYNLMKWRSTRKPVYNMFLGKVVYWSAEKAEKYIDDQVAQMLKLAELYSELGIKEKAVETRQCDASTE